MSRQQGSILGENDAGRGVPGQKEKPWQSRIKGNGHTMISWRDDGFFLEVEEKDQVTGALYWRRAQLCDFKMILAKEVEAERARCAAIVSAARLGNIDSDLRSLHHRITGGGAAPVVED